MIIDYKTGNEAIISNIGEQNWKEAWDQYYPMPHLNLYWQYPFRIEGHTRPFHLDFLHEPSKTAIEISGTGRNQHGRASIMRRDFMRYRWLMDHDYAVYTFTPEDVYKYAAKNISKSRWEEHTKQVFCAIMRRTT